MSNTLKTTVLLAALSALLLFIGEALGGAQGLVLAFVFAVVTNFVSYFYSDKIVLRMYGAREVGPGHPLHAAVARLAHRYGTPAYVLNSALGADPASRIFYNRVKGEVEQALAGVGFASLTCVRPGLIGGSRDEFRFGERLLVFVLNVAQPVLPAKWRVNPASRIARAMLDAAIDARPGVQVIASDRLV